MAGIIAAIVMSAVLWGDREEAFGGGFRADRFSLLLNMIFLGAAFLTLLLAWREPAAVDRRGEYAGLVMISVSGMMLVAGAGDLISIFLGIEVLSVALYVLCALEIWRERSLESGLKYLITGAVGRASCSTAWRCSSAPPAARRSTRSARPCRARRSRTSRW